MAEETIFSKIIKHEIPSDFRYQDDDVTVFADISPKAKVHLLIVPNKVIPSVNEIEDGDAALIGKMILTAKKMAKEMGFAENGYRLIINCGNDGGQEGVLQVVAQAEEIVKAMRGNADLDSALKDPGFTPEQKATLARNVFERNFDYLTVSDAHHETEVIFKNESSRFTSES